MLYHFQLVILVKNLYKLSSSYDKKLMPKKTRRKMRKVSSKIKISNQELKVISQFKYIGSIISEEGSGVEII